MPLYFRFSRGSAGSLEPECWDVPDDAQELPKSQRAKIIKATKNGGKDYAGLSKSLRAWVAGLGGEERQHIASVLEGRE